MDGNLADWRYHKKRASGLKNICGLSLIIWRAYVDGYGELLKCYSMIRNGTMDYM